MRQEAVGVGRDKFSFNHDETKVGDSRAEDLEHISARWGFILVVDEDTEGEFTAREKKETQNRYLEGVKKKKRNQQSLPKKNQLKDWPGDSTVLAEKELFQSKGKVSGVKYWQECQGGKSK